MKINHFCFNANPLIFVSLFIVMFSLFSNMCFAENQNLISKADQAIAMGDLDNAEKILAKAAKLNPEGYRALKALAELKFQLEKHEEADALIDQILKLEVTGGRKVLVFVEGEEKGRKGELIDETILKMVAPKTSGDEFIRPGALVPVEHFRIFLMDSGKAEFLPKNLVRVKYIGIPRVLREHVVILREKVKKRIIALAKPNVPEETVTVKGGCFLMGSEKGGPLEKPVHEVCVSSFKMDAKEVTQVAFQSIMDDNPSHFPGGNLPVDSVTWMEAKGYCKSSGKRLPTEAEWEYASRAGTQTNFYWGDDYDAAKANFCDGSCELNVRVADSSDGFKNTAPVGSFPPNPYGLYDMAGNVSEWVFDTHDPSYYIMSPKDNPSGWVPLQTEEVQLGPEQDFLAERSASRKIVRGGAWESHPSAGWSASRKVYYPGYRIEGVGFRCAADSDEVFQGVQKAE